MIKSWQSLWSIHRMLVRLLEGLLGTLESIILWEASLYEMLQVVYSFLNVVVLHISNNIRIHKSIACPEVDEVTLLAIWRHLSIDKGFL